MPVPDMLAFHWLHLSYMISTYKRARKFNQTPCGRRKDDSRLTYSILSATTMEI